MTSTLAPLRDPERELALSYAAASARPALHALWALDERLATLTTAGREPQLRLMRLLWWRDALARLDDAPAPAEPLLTVLAELVLPLGITGAALAELEDGWSVLADDELAIAEHARLRGATLFELSAHALGVAGYPVAAAGELWALIDRARAAADPSPPLTLAGRIDAGWQPWPTALRPLGALATLARRDARAGRLGTPGSPGRLARMVVHRLTGR